MNVTVLAAGYIRNHRPLLSSFFAYFSYQKKGRIRCFQDFQRDSKSKLYSHFFSVFSLYRQGESTWERRMPKWGQIIKEKRRKKRRGRLGVAQEKCFRQHMHISTAYTNTATHIPSTSHIRPCNPIYSLSLRFSPSSPFFPSICPFLHLIRTFLHYACTCHPLCTMYR